MSVISPSFLPGISRHVMKGLLTVMPHGETAVRQGAGVRAEVGTYCKEKKYQKILVVTGPVVGKLEIAQRLYDGLASEGVEYITFDEIQPNPLFSGCEAGSKIARQNNVDAIVAFGGGSVLDTAKIIGATMAYPKSSFRRFMVPFTAFKRFPIITIPTTAGTGCEVTFGSIISDDETQKKKNIGGPGYTPEICFLDVETTKDLPPDLTASTGMDALAHLMENYLASVQNREIKKLCEEGVRDIFEYLPRAYQNGASDLEAREKMMACAYKGGIAINCSGAAHGHALAHAIGGVYHLPHGEICGTILPEILRYYQGPCNEQLGKLAIASGLGTADESSQVLADRIVAHVFALRETLNLPVTVRGMHRNNLEAVKKEFWKQAVLFPTPVSMRETELDMLLNRLSEE
jgi:alcohol dehydrogenase class IV